MRWIGEPLLHPEPRFSVCSRPWAQLPAATKISGNGRVSFAAARSGPCVRIRQISASADALAYIVRRIKSSGSFAGWSRRNYSSAEPVTQTCSDASPQSPGSIFYRIGAKEWMESTPLDFAGIRRSQPVEQLACNQPELVGCHHQPSTRGCGWLR